MSLCDDDAGAAAAAAAVTIHLEKLYELNKFRP